MKPGNLTSKSLHKILINSLKNRNRWRIDTMKLAEKLSMTNKYPSEVIRKVEPALKQINKNTTLNIKLTIKYHKHGKTILHFYKIANNLEIKQKTNTKKNIAVFSSQIAATNSTLSSNQPNKTSQTIFFSRNI